MEFTKLSEVEVVETANDTDKVLIEQNGEIKRVPKTEVGGGGGGGGGNVLIITGDLETETFSANMSLTECVEVCRKHELTGVVAYISIPDLGGIFAGYNNVVWVDYSAMLGAECMTFMFKEVDLQLFWTASGFSTEPPM